MTEAIGGYFSLELPWHEELHKDAIKLNTGRNCLEYILITRKYRCVYIPYYTCEVLLEPFRKEKTSFKFYHIDLNFEIAEDISLKPGEALLYTNYFGLKQDYAKSLSLKFGTQLIIDNTQAFYSPPLKGVDTFYTCRKFFGVPDGAYLYTDAKLTVDFDQDTSFNRMLHLLKRIDLSAEDGFSDFRDADKSLSHQPIKHMSRLTQRLMQSANYQEIARIRRENYIFLNQYLSKSNKIHLPLQEKDVPMVYPYLSADKNLRSTLISNKIYVAQYWPNVTEWCPTYNVECLFSNHLIPIPCDQRYNILQMQRIINLTL